MTGLIVCVLCAWPLGATAADSVRQAASCTHIGSRLDRLACFDRLFGTPVEVRGREATESGPTRPEQYRIARRSEARRDADRDGIRFIAAPGETGRNRLWLTAPAIGAVPPRPTLMLGCVDDISRVELVFPNTMNIGTIDVAMIVDGRKRMAQRWLSDDSGYILRSGRGLPAIRVMKAMLGGRELRLKSRDSKIDGLQFDLHRLKEQVAPLRHLCRW